MPLPASCIQIKARNAVMEPGVMVMMMANESHGTPHRHGGHTEYSGSLVSFARLSMTVQQARFSSWGPCRDASSG